MRSPVWLGRGGFGLSRQGHTRRTDRPPSHGTGRVGLVSPASFNSGLWARLLRRTMTSFARDLDDARRVDELPKQPGRARPDEAFQPFGQVAVQEVRQHRQRQVEVHVQAHVAAQAIEVKERDLFTK